MTLVTNGIDTKKFRKANNPEIDRDSFIIGYAGIIGHAQNLTFVLEIAEKLLDNHKILFHLYGEGPEKSLVESWVVTHKLTNVRIFGHLSHDEVLTQMNTWSLGIVPLANTKLMSGALPSKMFEVMGSGIPVFLCAPKGEASKLIEDAHAGIWVSPDNVEHVAQSVISLFENKELLIHLGRNGKKFVDEFYDRDKILEQFNDVLEKMN